VILFGQARFMLFLGGLRVADIRRVRSRAPRVDRRWLRVRAAFAGIGVIAAVLGGLALVGLAIGFVIAFGVAQLLAKLLFGVSPVDPLTFAGVALLLAFVAALACYIPARRATKVDPLVALHYE